ncbi:MAG: S41 family peptidase [Candidatus Nomurabacteria bacterium]|nr:S41 family peptidase [Candidatus Nomurabacteria bacterium]
MNIRTHRKFWQQFVIVTILAGATFGIGFYAGAGQDDTYVVRLESSDTPDTLLADFGPFWRAWGVLNAKFPFEDTAPIEQARVWGAIKGLADAYGDPYTTFFDPQESERFESNISGEFGGVGMEVGSRDGLITVISPLKDTPAYKAGIKAGDKIIQVDDTVVVDTPIDEVISFIRGEVGSDVKLTIVRDSQDEPLEITVTRAIINVPTIETELRDNGVFIISLYNFYAQSPEKFRDALAKFLESGSDKLIIDVRGNPGGFLEASVDIASWFLSEGKPIVREEFGGDEQEIVYRSKGYNVFNNNSKLVMLVDGGSASASEILAGALSEHGIATLVGATTFGKGSVQELVKITPETSLKVTVAKWLTPDGNSISEGGIEPDYIVEFTDEDIENDIDTQLEKAVDILLGE